MDPIQKAKLAAQFADDKKAESQLLLDVRGICNFADAFLIVTANSPLHLRAMANHIADELKARGIARPAADGHGSDSWTVLDYGDVIVHLMTEETRGYYNIEGIWGAAPEVALSFPAGSRPGVS